MEYCDEDVWVLLYVSTWNFKIHMHTVLQWLGMHFHYIGVEKCNLSILSAGFEFFFYGGSNNEEFIILTSTIYILPPSQGRRFSREGLLTICSTKGHMAGILW